MSGAGRDRVRPPRPADPSAGRHPGLAATFFPPGPGTGPGGGAHRQRGVTLLYHYRNGQGRGAAAALFRFFYPGSDAPGALTALMYFLLLCYYYARPSGKAVRLDHGGISSYYLKSFHIARRMSRRKDGFPAGWYLPRAKAVPAVPR